MPTGLRVSAIDFIAARRFESDAIPQFLALVGDGMSPQAAKAVLPARVVDGDALISIADMCGSLPPGALAAAFRAPLAPAQQRLLLLLMDGRTLDELEAMTVFVETLDIAECRELAAASAETGRFLEADLRQHRSPVAMPGAAAVKAAQPRSGRSSEYSNLRALKVARNASDRWKAVFDVALTQAPPLPDGFAQQCGAVRMDSDTLLLVVLLMRTGDASEIPVVIAQARAMPGMQRRAIAQTLEKCAFAMPLSVDAIEHAVAHDLSYEATRAFVMLASEVATHELDNLADACAHIHVETGWQYAASVIVRSAQARAELAGRLVVGVAPGNHPVDYGQLQAFCDAYTQRFRARSTSFRTLD